MIIIKNNNTIKIICKHCNSILEITVEDILDYEMVGTFVHCIACDCQTPIERKDIPKSWWACIEEI